MNCDLLVINKIDLAQHVGANLNVMKNDTGLLVRILGSETESVKNIILEIVASVRKTSIGVSFSGIRKN